MQITIDELVATLLERGRGARHITAVVGPPGAGKSTVAETLAEKLNELDPESAAVLPMDGYHFDDAILNARGWRPRKGAPHTFDVGGFHRMLVRLRENTEVEVAVPVFDRSIEIARNAARFIPQTVRHLIVEGNYLLLDASGWRDLAPLFDTTVYLEVPLDEIRRRLLDRWAELSGDALQQKMEENDLPNAELVIRASRPAEFVVANA